MTGIFGGFSGRIDASLVPELESRVARASVTAREAWPEVHVADEVFVPYLAARLPEDEDPLAALEKAHVTDLYLACACAQGDSAALRLFESGGFLSLEGLRVRLQGDDNFDTELRQVVRERLFVGQGGQLPKIGDYSGRGPLKGWVRVVATRAALNLLRGPKRVVDEEALLANRASGGDVETEIIKKRYQPEFRAAFRDAMASLSSRERNVLRQYYIDELTMDRIGALYGVHRITVVRWLTKSRENLERETRRALAARLRIEGDELESIVRLAQSAFDLSVRTFFVTSSGDSS